jgi:hypothetical protein
MAIFSAIAWPTLVGHRAAVRSGQEAGGVKERQVAADGDRRCVEALGELADRHRALEADGVENQVASLRCNHPAIIRTRDDL